MPRMGVDICLNGIHDNTCVARPKNALSVYYCHCPCHWSKRKMNHELKKLLK